MLMEPAKVNTLTLTPMARKSLLLTPPVKTDSKFPEIICQRLQLHSQCLLQLLQLTHQHHDTTQPHNTTLSPNNNNKITKTLLLPSTTIASDKITIINNPNSNTTTTISNQFTPLPPPHPQADSSHQASSTLTVPLTVSSTLSPHKFHSSEPIIIAY